MKQTANAKGKPMSFDQRQLQNWMIISSMMFVMGLIGGFTFARILQ